MKVKWSGVKLVVWAGIILLAMAAGWAFFQTDLGRWLVDGVAGLVGMVGLSPAIVAQFAVIILFVIFVADIIDSHDGNPAALAATILLPGAALMAGGGGVASIVNQLWPGGYNVVVGFLASGGG
jgi:hypothetical protein